MVYWCLLCHSFRLLSRSISFECDHALENILKLHQFCGFTSLMFVWSTYFHLTFHVSWPVKFWEASLHHMALVSCQCALTFGFLQVAVASAGQALCFRGAQICNIQAECWVVHKWFWLINSKQIDHLKPQQTCPCSFDNFIQFQCVMGLGVCWGAFSEAPRRICKVEVYIYHILSILIIIIHYPGIFLQRKAY